MFETSIDDLFLPFGQETELVDNLLSGVESDGECDGSSSASLARAFCPAAESPSSPLVPLDCSTRYKTELCSSYSSDSSCKYAEHCQFAHGLHELRAPSRHPKYKTELCRNYHTTGYCYYGLRCLFVHSPTEQRSVARRRRNVPCRNQRAFGVCPFGTRCIFQHAEGKNAGRGEDAPEVKARPAGSPRAKDKKPSSKALCHTFSTFGFCLYGTSCLLQHCLPSKTKAPEPSKGGSVAAPPPQRSRVPSRLPLPLPSTSTGSSTSASPLPTPSPDGEEAHNAFNFSSQHLSELLLPLALQLQRLDSSKAQEIWDNRAV